MLAPDKIKRLIDLVVDNGLTALEMTQGDVRLRIEAGSGSSSLDLASAATGSVEQIARPATPQRTAQPTNPPAPNVVRAPTDGIVHLAPSPGTAPFVSAGQRVKPDDTICMIEVMKMFFPVTAKVSGTVEAIRVEDGRQVSFDEVLLVLS